MSAILSPCGLYRYSLTRQINDLPFGGGILFVMLNPSTADAEEDDPTIRRCLSYAQREGADYLEVVNLFAFRATNPKVLEVTADPVGPDNSRYIQEAAARAGRIVVAWGAYPMAEHRVAPVCKLLGHPDRELFCLGTTAGGSPRHPLYIKSDQPLERWKP